VEFDLDRLRELSLGDLVDAVPTIGDDLFIYLAQTNAGRTLAQSVAISNVGRTLAQTVAGRSLAQSVARSVADSVAGHTLALYLAQTMVGRAQAIDLAQTDAGRTLAIDLAQTDAVVNLAIDLAQTDAGCTLAIDLAQTDAGAALAIDLAETDAGRTLAQSVADSDAGRTLAQSVADSDAGRTLAGALTRTGTGIILPFELAETDAGRTLAGALAQTDAGRTLVGALAQTDAVVLLAGAMTQTDAGRTLAGALAQTDAGRTLAIDVAEIVVDHRQPGESAQTRVAALVVFVALVGGLVESGAALISGAAASVVANAAAIRTDSSRSEEDVDSDGDSGGLALREEFREEHAATARAATEPFMRAVQRYIDDEKNTVLDRVDENYLRTQLGKLRLEYQLIDEADDADIRRTIGKIVQRLLETQQFGNRTRELLVELGGEPPEAIDEIIAKLQDTLADIVGWVNEADAAERDEGATVATIDRPTTAAIEIASQVQSIVSPYRLEQFVDKYVDGVGTQAGKRTVDGAILGLGSLAGYYMAKFGGVDIDVIMYHLTSALPDLHGAFLERRKPRPDLPSEN